MKRSYTLTILKSGVLIIIAVSVLFSSACSRLGFGSEIPTSTSHIAFENDTHLIVDYFLLDKQSGEANLLTADYDAEIPGVDNIYYRGPYTYNYIFKESEIEEYTFLKTNYYSHEIDGFVDQYYNCVFTYDYNGKELRRRYIGDPVTQEQAKEFYNNAIGLSDAFNYEIDILYDNNKPTDISSSQQAILNYVEAIYLKHEKPYTVMGTAKTVSNKIWFSVTGSNTHGFNSGNALLGGIDSSQIVSYNTDSKEFETVFNYNKRFTTIIDFDESGMYTFDDNGKLKYYDFKSKKATTIHDFSGIVSDFQVTDDYICAYYGTDSKGYYYFAYNKNGTIIANKRCII